MGYLKYLARHFIFPFALSVRADKYLLKKTSKNCCILNFHGIRKGEHYFNNRHLHTTEFEKMIVYLKLNYAIVTLSELFEIHREKRKVKRRTIALTFDDGYANNFDNAFPILKKYNIPATFYIVSKSLVTDNYLLWPDVIDLLKKYHKADITINNHTFKYPSFYNAGLKTELFRYLKGLGDQAELLTYSILGENNYPEQEIKTAPELVQLISSSNILKFVDEPLIEFGSHSHNHFNMEVLDRQTAENQLKQSKEIIEKKIGKKVISFAFPDGSYKKATVELAKEAGYKNIVAVEYRYNENNNNPNLLARFTVSNSSTYECNAIRLAKQFGSYGF